jgi:hypothetical protein
MFERHSLAAFVLVTLPSVGLAQAFEYAPMRGQYRVTQVTKIAQEAMGQKQDFETSGSQVVTITLARKAKDTLTMTTIIDSVSQTGPMGPTPGLDKLIGMKADAKLSPTGALYSTSIKDSTVAGALGVADAAGRFLPRIKARLAPGAKWVDTTSGKLRQTGIEVDRKTVSRFSVVGDTTVAGEKSWKIMRDDSTSMTGSGMSQGQALSMEGVSIGSGALFLSQKGTYVGGEGTEKATIKLVLAANGLEINVVQEAKTKVEKVK